jgi:hypothetical protein
MQVLAHTKSLKGLSGNFSSMIESYTRYGFEMPKVLYTDNVAADKNSLESYIPSLLKDVKPLVGKNVDDRTMSSIDLDNLPLAEIPVHLNIVLKDTEKDINKACQIILGDADTEDEIFVGFDCEWVAPNFRRVLKITSHVSLIQIFHKKSLTVYLFRIHKFDKTTFPKTLEQLIISK